MKKSRKKLIIYTLGIFVLFSFGAISLLSFYSGNPAEACADDFDCKAGKKCENSTCVDVGCVDEGEDIPGAIAPEYLEHMPTECCEDLKEINYFANYDDECNLIPIPGAPAGTCSKCGNNTCEDWESKCNCPADCK